MSEVTPYGLLHKVLLQKGYKKDSSFRHLYQQDIKINDVAFPVKLALHDPYFQNLPTVFLSSIPEGLPFRLPHILDHLVLCYIDESSFYIDQYDMEQNMLMVIELVSKLLHQYVDHPELIQNEFRRELSYYWNGSLYDYCYLLSDDKKNISHSVFVKKRIGCTKSIPEVIIGEDQQLQEWIKRRDGEFRSSGSAKIIALSDEITIPESYWPPENLLAVIDWLTQCGDKNAANQLVEFVAESLAGKSSYTVIFKLNTIYLGIIVTETKSKVTTILKTALNRNSGNKKNKQRISRERKISLIKRAMHDGKPSFCRFNVEVATTQHVIGRNLNNKKNLGNLKIAQIGCGTVGGLSAQMLIQAGAGSNAGYLDLYDSDSVRPENLARHVLGMKYLGENKAKAMTHWLKENNVSDVCVSAHTDKVKVPAFLEEQHKYDLIVDATGDAKFSTMLCHCMHRSKNKTPIIYGWVDALGLASRGLYDDCKPGNACYFCIININKVTGVQDNLFKKGVEIPKWQPESCGVGSYLPFSSQASACAASLIQGLCLDWVNGDVTPRFRHITNDHNRVFGRKSKNEKSTKDCPCCQNINHA